jgi:hypothetical protein
MQMIGHETVRQNLKILFARSSPKWRQHCFYNRDGSEDFPTVRRAKPQMISMLSAIAE